MIIKKIDEEITYKRITTTHEFEVNGKKIHIYEYDNYDSLANDYEQDYDIDENDKEKLTEEELELFTDDVMANLDLEVGEELEIEE